MLSLWHLNKLPPSQSPLAPKIFPQPHPFLVSLWCFETSIPIFNSTLFRTLSWLLKSYIFIWSMVIIIFPLLPDTNPYPPFQRLPLFPPCSLFSVDLAFSLSLPHKFHIKWNKKHQWYGSTLQILERKIREWMTISPFGCIWFWSELLGTIYHPFRKNENFWTKFAEVGCKYRCPVSMYSYVLPSQMFICFVTEAIG